MKKIIQKFLNMAGYRLVSLSSKTLGEEVAEDMADANFPAIYKKSKPYTMTTKEKMFALYQAVQYIEHSGIPGEFVECGVWRGGSAMVMAETLCALGKPDRTIYLYDTFTGMSEPTEIDKKKSQGGVDAVVKWKEKQREGYNAWCYASLEEVKENLSKTAYPADKLVYVKGKVEDTIPGTMPDAISILRLDTDFYESSYHELKHLFPRLSKGGVLLLDDYGSWQGARRAADRYFKEAGINMLLDRIDTNGRIAINV